MSTTAVAKRIWAAAAAGFAPGRSAAPQSRRRPLKRAFTEVAAAIEQERDWRHRYPVHLVALTEAAVRSGTEVAMAKAGLGAIRAEFRFCRDGAEVPIAEAGPHESQVFSTHKVAGTGPAVPFQVPTAEGAEPKTGSAHPATAAAATPLIIRTACRAAAVALCRALADYGACEPSVAESIAALAAAPAAAVEAVLAGSIFVLLGATSELGPVRTLLSLGATVAAVARPGAKLAALMEYAVTTAGTLLVPKRTDSSGADILGGDVIQQMPEVAQWVAQLDPGAPAPLRRFAVRLLTAQSSPARTAVISSLIYLDSEANVRACVGMDEVCARAMAARPAGRTALSFLVSPATAHTVPEAAAEQSARQLASR